MIINVVRNWKSCTWTLNFLDQSETSPTTFSTQYNHHIKLARCTIQFNIRQPIIELKRIIFRVTIPVSFKQFLLLLISQNHMLCGGAIVKDENRKGFEPNVKQVWKDSHNQKQFVTRINHCFSLKWMGYSRFYCAYIWDARTPSPTLHV